MVWSMYVYVKLAGFAALAPLVLDLIINLYYNDYRLIMTAIFSSINVKDNELCRYTHVITRYKLQIELNFLRLVYVG